jgi:hypothetical protein
MEWSKITAAKLDTKLLEGVSFSEGRIDLVPIQFFISWCKQLAFEGILSDNNHCSTTQNIFAYICIKNKEVKSLFLRPKVA